MQPLLILRVHTDLRLGMGHVARALAIQDVWGALGGRSCLAVSGDLRARRVGGGLHPFLEQPLPCQAVDLGEALEAPIPEELRSQAAVVLVDQWDTTLSQIQALHPLPVAVMEDDGEAHEQANLLFQPYLEGVHWPAGPVRAVNGQKVHPCETSHGGCRVLRGLGYVVVSPIATLQRPRREPQQPLSVRKLLLTFGGTDGPGLGQRAYDVLGILAANGRWRGTATLVAPQGVKGGPVPGCTVIPQLSELTRRISDYDAIWCAMGLTLAEAMCLGVPAAAWGQNERQARMIGDVARANGCFSLGEGPGADLAPSAEALAQWLGPVGQEARQEQVRDGMVLVDGMGASRVAQELWSLAKSRG